MVLIEEGKLEEIVRKAVKEEMVAILTGTGKAMNFTINVTVKKDVEAIPPTGESNLAKKEVVLPDKEIIQKKQDANYPPAPRLLNSLAELAEFLQISKPTALKLKNSGCFPYRKLGNKLIFNSEEVLKGVTVEKRDQIHK